MNEPNKSHILLAKRGFSVVAMAGDFKCIIAVDKNGISLKYYADSDDFELSYVITKALSFQVVSNRCGSFSNDANFDRFYSKIKRIVNLLKSGGYE